MWLQPPGSRRTGHWTLKLDEAHDVEDTLRDANNGKLGEFEITFDGPTGDGYGGKPIFMLSGLTLSDFDILSLFVDALEKYFRGNEGTDVS